MATGHSKSWKLSEGSPSPALTDFSSPKTWEGNKEDIDWVKQSSG